MLRIFLLFLLFIPSQAFAKDKIIAIAATQDAATSSTYGTKEHITGKICFVLDGTLAPDETIAIEVLGATAFIPVVESGAPAVLSENDSVLCTDKPGDYRVVKQVTAAAAGVTIYR